MYFGSCAAQISWLKGKTPMEKIRQPSKRFFFPAVSDIVKTGLCLFGPEKSSTKCLIQLVHFKISIEHLTVPFKENIFLLLLVKSQGTVSLGELHRQPQESYSPISL